MSRNIGWLLLYSTILSSCCTFSHGFTITQSTFSSATHAKKLYRPLLSLSAEEEETEQDVVCWSPSLRRIMAGAASLGALETAYLTFTKLSSDGTATMGALCGTNGDCGSVLSGPYSNIPGTGIPLAAVGCVAYTITAILSVSPLLGNSSDDDDDSTNRVAILALSTAMATFSTFLMSLLFSVLHASCPFCLASSTLSWTLAACAWVGGCLPSSQRTLGLQSSAYGFLASTAAAVAIFVSVDTPSLSSYSSTATTTTATTTALVATAATTTTELQSPPPITTTSSKRALAIAEELQGLDATMYGAFWCSHCYDQKQSLGKQAFSKLRYVECSKDGVNSKTSLCREKDVPGYPTWEIGGKLYPGEQELEELEDIILDSKR